MRAGELRHRITIRKRGGGKDAFGQPLPNDWVDVASVWANIRHLN